MTANPLAEFPPLHDTRYSRERLLDELSNDGPLPSGAVAVATLYAQEIEPDILALVERASTEVLDPPSERLLFCGLHILGGRRFTSVYRPLIAFLRGPQDRVDELLGDAVTQTLTKILAGCCDGDEAPLLDVIADNSVNHFVRDAAMGALAFLAFDGRVPKQKVEDFLLRFDVERMAPDDDELMWHAWMTAAALLGLKRLSPRVRAAFADGRIAPEFCDEDAYDELLTAALERPDDSERFARENLGYIDDVLVALEGYRWDDDSSDHDGDDITEDGLLDRAAGRVPAHNPFRHVGRNDPCPCGSGKKSKKCCLQ
jgi:hypothetical protein